jgi:transcriptional regulator with XRE-family HTH domain
VKTAGDDDGVAVAEMTAWGPPPSPNGEFGERLRRLREARRLSVRRLARLVSVSPSYLSRIERSHVPPPSEKTIAKIARTLMIEPDDLLATAGRIPEDVAAKVLRRPQVMARLVRVADGLSDEKVSEVCGELERKG